MASLTGLGSALSGSTHSRYKAVLRALNVYLEARAGGKGGRGGGTDEGWGGSGGRTGGREVCGDIVNETWLLPLLLLLMLSCSVRRLELLLLVASVRCSEL